MTLITILGAIVAVDHILAANPSWKSNSTGQFIFNAIGAIGSALINVLAGSNDSK